MTALIDLTGQTFGSWTVLYRAPSQGKATMWACHCLCGYEADVQSHNLIIGATRSCYKCQERRLSQVIDLTGQTFGRWTVLSKSEGPSKQTKWLCRCTCGIEVDVRAGTLVNGRSKGCRGCFLKRIRS